jgi:putative membrane protein
MLDVVSDDIDSERRAAIGPADAGAERRTNLADQRTDLAGQRTDLADRRTNLANERTLLAWWRTGLTALAVALGVGRLLPELATGSDRWPFIAIGVAFAIYGIALLLYGTRRSAERDPHLLSGSGPTADRLLAALTAGGVLLGIASAVLIISQ